MKSKAKNVSPFMLLAKAKQSVEEEKVTKIIKASKQNHRDQHRDDNEHSDDTASTATIVQIQSRKKSS
jgi:hypothetical protein